MQARIGATLYWIGVFGFPAAIGAIFGFYAADQGVPWLPDMVSAVLAVAAVALLLVVIGRSVRGHTFVQTTEGVRLSRRVIVASALVLVAAAGRLTVFAFELPSPLTELSPEAYEEAFEVDSAQYRELARGIDALVRRVEADPAFDGTKEVLDADAEARLLDAWSALYDQSLALDEIRVFWEDWYRFDPSRAGRDDHLRAFLLTFAAELALVEGSARFSAVVLRNPNARKYLDAAHPELGLQEGSYSLLRQATLGTRDQARIAAGAQYLGFLDQVLHARRDARRLQVHGLWRRVEVHLDGVRDVGLLERGVLTVNGDAQVFKRKVRRSWYPAQSKVAEWIGDTRVRRIGRYLISEEQMAAADAALQPGDILFSRKNWYLSNVGLPGFWPHALLYVGSPERVDAAFDDDEVRAWLAERSEATTMSAYLAERHPDAWAALVTPEHGAPTPILEAISEGVTFSTWEHAAGDYLAGVGPKLSPLARAQALDEALSHYGKPYDFDFDFATDHAIVCSELVWRAYRPAEGKEGLDLELVSVAGRRTLPANDLLIELLDDELVEFRVFFDARERQGLAVEAGPEALSASPARVKWDFAQQ